MKFDVTPIWKTIHMPEPPWVVPGIARERTLTLIQAMPGTGKSALALHAAMCGAACRSFLGQYDPIPSPQRALFIGLDAPGYDYGILARKIAAGLGVEVRGSIDEDEGWPPVFLTHDRRICLTDPSFFDLLKQSTAVIPVGYTDAEGRAVEVVKKPKLIVIDAFINVHDRDENDNAQMREVCRYLRLLADSGPAVVVLHHTAKSRTGNTYAARGAGAIAGSFDMQLELRVKKKLSKGARILEGSWHKGRGADLEDEISYAVRWDRESYVYGPPPDAAAELDAICSPALANVLSDTPVSWQTLMSALKGRSISPSQLKMYLADCPWIQKTDAGYVLNMAEPPGGFPRLPGTI